MYNRIEEIVNDSVKQSGLYNNKKFDKENNIWK